MTLGAMTPSQTSTAPGAHRDATAFRGAQRHSRHVRVLKFVLPVLGTIVACGFIAYSWLLSPSNIAISIDSSAIRDGKLVMANPKLDGFTRENRPFTLKAARAIQDLSRTGEINLETIDARFPIDAQDWVTVKAATGVYDDGNNKLAMTSPVTVETTSGVTVQLKSASIDIESGALVTPDPVEIAQDGSRITADSLRVSDKGTVFVFDKRVRVTIEPRVIRSADAGSSDGAKGN